MIKRVSCTISVLSLSLSQTKEFLDKTNVQYTPNGFESVPPTFIWVSTIRTVKMSLLIKCSRLVLVLKFKQARHCRMWQPAYRYYIIIYQFVRLFNSKQTLLILSNFISSIHLLLIASCYFFKKNKIQVSWVRLFK